MDHDTLGTRIRKLREEQRLSLAKAADGHFSRAFLHQVEHGQSQPSVGVLRLIARRLDASLDQLVEGESRFVRRELILERARLALARGDAARALELVGSAGPTEAWPLGADLRLTEAEAQLELGAVEAATAILDEVEASVAAHEDGGRQAQIAALRRGRPQRLDAEEAEKLAEERLRAGDAEGALQHLRRARILVEAARPSPRPTRARGRDAAGRVR